MTEATGPLPTSGDHDGHTINVGYVHTLTDDGACRDNCPHPSHRAEQEPPRYACAECGGPLTVADNFNGGLITVNVGGHAKPAHRICPTDTSSGSEPTDG